ncbi:MULTISPECIES: F0F1 ATP synthase subunit gamma [Streptomycetaceae]|uniref:ATP synthase gamma chain n=1 Tax=Streptantibioticus cattleyicolor (strain ATCC 35852 / DSM 46488 / JCM 4925 / NBRC 14057 / NRRL 8057) TaxID=1003195 RepID=F8JQ90_STREN|nr:MULTISPECIES: F0F1 ATP synthase subunit gamma [Streptomycetaceae]AEW96553.1 F0F1 ATP synthase subunit gamma [Streptantibioticus cattleyicolor NRRL 8057 = DSM 46488]MYS61052.1 F0F1 ATP synthase subunit gamma [Streptomyces sp. SID5468]CCB76890.1 ATP synthase (subunit gamma, component F1) [Streptantibioticus cattleyicolor NRRL 8057 = DSM 46488]
MGAQLRVYKRRIKSVSATKKITRAMEMIAAARVVKAQRAVAASTPYATELTRAVAAVAKGSNDRHPLTTEAERPTRAAVLLVTSDRGLAGGYSANVIKKAEELTARLVAEGKEVLPYVVGRKGVAYYNFRGRDVAQSWTGFTESPTYADAKAIADPLIETVIKATEEGGVDELHIVYTEFQSMMTQVPVEARLLPLSLKEATDSVEKSDKLLPLFEFEPSAEGVLDALLPRYVESRVYNALLQAAASKHAATRRAMKSATDNAEELIKSLTRLANAARQADITQEISEIVGGAAALADATAGSD